MKKEGWSDTVHHHYGFWPSYADSVIIEMHTSNGLVGIGEATVLPWYYGNTLEHNQAMLELYGRSISGQDPENLALIHKLVGASIGYGAPGPKASIDALDMALFDIIGQARSQPIYGLLGGAYQTEFDLQTNLYLDTPDAMAEAALEYVKRGFQGLKIKCGMEVEERGWSLKGANDDIRKLVKTLEVVPESISVDADFNQSWGTAMRTIQFVKSFGLERYSNLALEQPTKFQDITGAGEIVKAVRLPLVLDEAIYSPEMLIEVIRHKAAHRIVAKPPRVGGLTESRRLIVIAEAAGINVSVDGGPYSKIGDTSLCHLAATVKEPYPLDCEFHTWIKENPVKSGGVELEGGKAKMSPAAGLGVKLDYDAIESMKVPAPS